MKRYLSIVAILFVAEMSLLSQTVSNVRAVQDGKQIKIYYNLSEKADISIYLSRDGGRNYESTPIGHISGMVGSDVNGGTDRCAVWDVLADRERLQGDRIRFKVSAVSTNQWFSLGLDYYNGSNGKPKDYAESLKWSMKAALRGHAGAQNTVGCIYSNDVSGVPKDDAEAVKWFRKSAEQGNHYAQCNLGMMYLDGSGVSQSRDNALYWYRKAAAQGNEYAKKKIVELMSNRVITVGNVSFTMIYVEGGTFTMGCTGKEGECDESKKVRPPHKVTLPTFYIGETEVTQQLWEEVMGYNPSIHKKDMLTAKKIVDKAISVTQNRYDRERRERLHLVSQYIITSHWGKESLLPVENVSYDECQKFITLLNQRTGMNFALPSSAQWEYAARGGNKSLDYKYSGSDYPYSVGWTGWAIDNLFRYAYGYDYYEVASGEPELLRRTIAVKSFKPNELGIYDMCGNVFEWCSDYHNPDKSHVVRGGSYVRSPWYVWDDSWSLNKYGYEWLGLRLILQPE